MDFLTSTIYNNLKKRCYGYGIGWIKTQLPEQKYSLSEGARDIKTVSQLKILVNIVKKDESSGLTHPNDDSVKQNVYSDLPKSNGTVTSDDKKIPAEGVYENIEEDSFSALTSSSDHRALPNDYSDISMTKTTDASHDNKYSDENVYEDVRVIYSVSENDNKDNVLKKVKAALNKIKELKKEKEIDGFKRAELSRS